jgi:hypothetical protein
VRRVAALAIALAAAGAGCGGTSGKVLERNDVPPGSNLRVDVFLLRSVSTCAAGSPCTDPAQCFTLSDATGTRAAFAADTVQFLAPGDPQLASAPSSQCFRLVAEDAQVSALSQLLAGLRTRVFQLTGGDINLDIRTHEIASLDAPFNRFYVGMFLPPTSLESVALADVTRDTDFAFAVTGYRDPDSGLVPKLDQCAGTNWLDQGGLGGSTYTWVAMSDGCARPSTFLRAWLFQLYFGLRDVTRFAGTSSSADYPGCGRGGPDPTRWFPWVEDCTSDPDAPACGASSCQDQDAYYAHMLTAHWARGRPFNGNYCSDGRMDFDETAVDSGGRCDLIH